MYDSHYTNTDTDEFNVDTPVDVILAHAAARQSPQRPGFIPSNTYSQLSPAAREHWAAIPPEDRALLLGMQTRANHVGSSSRPPAAPSSSRTPGRHPGRPPDRQRTHYTETDIDTLVAQLHQLLTASSPAPAPPPTIAAHQAATAPSLAPAAPTPAPPPQVGNAITPGDIRAMLRNTRSASSAMVNGQQVRFENHKHEIIYNVSYANARGADHSLVNRGSNGGVVGKDMRVISTHPTCKVTVQGINMHQLPEIPVCTVGGVVDSSIGQVIVICPHYAYHGQHSTIHCPGQWEYYGQDVCDKSRTVGGRQSIITTNKVTIPLDFVNGLPRLPIRPFTDQEWDNLPHIFLADEARD